MNQDETQTQSTQQTSNTTSLNNPDFERLLDVNMSLSIEIGRAQIKLNDLLNLSKGSVIELDKLSGEPLDIFANGKLIAHGEVISVNGKYGIRITSVHHQTSNATK